METIQAVAVRESVEQQASDSDGNEYRYTLTERGATIFRCLARAKSVQVPAILGGARVVEIAPEAFAASEKLVMPPRPQAQERSGQRVAQTYFDLRKNNRNGQIERVVLPEGLVSIGRAAFRGCNNLREVVLPSSLESIDDLAFSCTAIRALALPAACTNLSANALRTGPETVAGVEGAYVSKIECLSVDPGNPVYHMVGGMLCRPVKWEETAPESALEVVFCANKCDEVDLRSIARIAPQAFEGVSEIGVLRIDGTVEYDERVGLVSRAACTRVVVEHTAGNPAGGECVLSLEMPDAALCRKVLEVTRGASHLDAATLAAAYDELLPEVGDQLTRLRLMLARVADPQLLSESTRASFERELQPNLVSLVAHFGARGMWEQFDLLADAALLTETAITRVVDALTALSDAASVGYLLELKRTRFGKAAWDYAL